MAKHKHSAHTGKKNTLRFVFGLINTLLATAGFRFVWYEFVQDNNQTGHLLGRGNILMSVGIYIVLLFTIMQWMGAYRIGFSRKMNLVASVVLSFLVVDFMDVFVSVAVVGQFRWFWRFFWRYLLLFLVQSVVIGILSGLELDLYRRLIPPLHMIEVYGEKADPENSLFKKMNEISYKYIVEKKVLCSSGDDLKQVIKEFKHYDAVLVNDLPDEEQNIVIKACFDLDKRIYYVPKISDILRMHSDYINLIDTPLYMKRNEGIPVVELAFKRFFDIIFSGLALVILSPVFLIVSIVIKAEDGGPVFYRQERVTLNGRKFMILKFRSMIVDAEKDGKFQPAGKDDDRITKVGKVIRSSRIDELPQLINILKGDMSIIGPRPERVEHVEIYTSQIPEFKLREKMRGGLSGYAQVYGKYNTTALDKLKMDLIYINNYSLLVDLQLIFETIKILFQKERTEGFSDERQQEIMSEEVTVSANEDTDRRDGVLTAANEQNENQHK